MRLPESKLLRGLIGWFAAGVLFRLMIAAFRRDRTVSDAFGNFIIDLLVPYFLGSFCSHVPLVWIGSALFGIVYAISVTNPGAATTVVARLSLFAILSFSLFTVWLEPYMSLSGVATNVAMELAKVPMKFVDLGVSVFWLVLYVRASRAVGREPRRAADTVRGEALPSPAGLGWKAGMIGSGLILGCVLLALGLVGYLMITQ